MVFLEPLDPISFYPHSCYLETNLPHLFSFALAAITFDSDFLPPRLFFLTSTRLVYYPS